MKSLKKYLKESETYGIWDSEPTDRTEMGESCGKLKEATMSDIPHEIDDQIHKLKDMRFDLEETQKNWKLAGLDTTPLSNVITGINELIHSMYNNGAKLADQEVINEAERLSMGIGFKNISGKIDWDLGKDDVRLCMKGVGANYYAYDNEALKAKNAGGAEWSKWVDTKWESVKDKLFSLADKFDNDVLKIMTQSGFKKKL